MKKLITFLLLTVLLSSCQSACKSDPYIEGQDGWIIDLTYFRDTRTNLCFALISSDTRSLTCVPCDSVSKLIKK